MANCSVKNASFVSTRVESEHGCSKESNSKTFSRILDMIFYNEVKSDLKVHNVPYSFLKDF